MQMLINKLSRQEEHPPSIYQAPISLDTTKSLEKYVDADRDHGKQDKASSRERFTGSLYFAQVPMYSRIISPCGRVLIKGADGVWYNFLPNGGYGRPFSVSVFLYSFDLDQCN